MSETYPSQDSIGVLCVQPNQAAWFETMRNDLDQLPDCEAEFIGHDLPGMTARDSRRKNTVWTRR